MTAIEALIYILIKNNSFATVTSGRTQFPSISSAKELSECKDNTSESEKQAFDKKIIKLIKKNAGEPVDQ